MRRADRWLSKPGGFDALHLSPEFEIPRTTSNLYGIPNVYADIRIDPAYVSAHLVRIDARAPEDAWVHFFTDDYRFESFWNKPINGLSRVKQYAGVCGPDFSCYADWPMAANLWNVYRSRWLTAYWQMHGVLVVPSVTWAGPESFAFAFAGLPQNSVLALGGVPKSLSARQGYYTGIMALCRAVAPRALIFVGTVTDALQDYLTDARIACFPVATQYGAEQG